MASLSGRFLVAASSMYRKDVEESRRMYGNHEAKAVDVSKAAYDRLKELEFQLAHSLDIEYDDAQQLMSNIGRIFVINSEFCKKQAEEKRNPY